MPAVPELPRPQNNCISRSTFVTGDGGIALALLITSFPGIIWPSPEYQAALRTPQCSYRIITLPHSQRFRENACSLFLLREKRQSLHKGTCHYSDNILTIFCHVYSNNFSTNFVYQDISIIPYIFLSFNSTYRPLSSLHWIVLIQLVPSFSCQISVIDLTGVLLYS